MKPEWMSMTFSLAHLREMARPFGHLTNVTSWLYRIGVMPDVQVRAMNPRVELDPDAIPADYLASVAAEWDEMGPSSPKQFLDALECETRGSKRDVIVEALSLAGAPAWG